MCFYVTAGVDDAKILDFWWLRIVKFERSELESLHSFILFYLLCFAFNLEFIFFFLQLVP